MSELDALLNLGKEREDQLLQVQQQVAQVTSLHHYYDSGASRLKAENAKQSERIETLTRLLAAKESDCLAAQTAEMEFRLKRRLLLDRRGALESKMAALERRNRSLAPRVEETRALCDKVWTRDGLAWRKDVRVCERQEALDEEAAGIAEFSALQSQRALALELLPYKPLPALDGRQLYVALADAALVAQRPSQVEGRDDAALAERVDVEFSNNAANFKMPEPMKRSAVSRRCDREVELADESATDVEQSPFQDRTQLLTEETPDRDVPTVDSEEITSSIDMVASSCLPLERQDLLVPEVEEPQETNGLASMSSSPAESSWGGGGAASFLPDQTASPHQPNWGVPNMSNSSSTVYDTFGFGDDNFSQPNFSFGSSSPNPYFDAPPDSLGGGGYFGFNL